MAKYIFEHENWTDLIWHAALFPTGYRSLYPIETGKYQTGVMQIVSAAMGKEKRYYKAIKPEFWNLHESTPINKGQRLMINKLFDGFDGKLQTSKWAKITKTSTDTALRDIKDLVDKGVLIQTNDGGRNVSYLLKHTKRSD
jgi:hypothetical protein